MKTYLYVVTYGHLQNQDDEDSLETYLNFNGRKGFKLKQIIIEPEGLHAHAVMYREDII